MSQNKRLLLCAASLGLATFISWALFMDSEAAIRGYYYMAGSLFVFGLCFPEGRE